MNIDKIRAKLNTLSTVNSNRNLQWKPTGKHVIRILPNVNNPETPFSELFFHYGFGKDKKNYLSPITNGRDDPIVNYATQLKKSGDKQEYKIGKSLEPKMRVYAAILVRGEESEGPKYWGFGKTVYQELLSIIADPEYGDISDLKNGFDITVEFIPKTETGKDFPDTAVRAKRTPSPAFDPSNKDLMSKIKSMKTLGELYPEPTYDDLYKVLENFLKPSSDVSSTINYNDGDDDNEETSNMKEEVVVEKKPVHHAKINKDTALEEFDSLFKTKR